MNRKPEDIRLALDATLSGVSHDPALYNRIVQAAKGDPLPVKRKWTLSMALVLVLALITCTVALAAAYRGVSYFMYEKYNEPVTLDEEYLLSGLRQHYHNGNHLDASVVDAYWDGVKFSVAYRVSPADPAQTVRIPCNYPEHDHYLPAEDADILLQTPSFINITDDTSGEITHPHSRSNNWVYEEDGALSLVISFPLNSMSRPISISIPIFYTLSDTGESIQSLLHCYPPVLADPIPAHEHDWLDAFCASPKTCTICSRTEGELGDHDQQPTEDGKKLVCKGCGYEQNWPAAIPSSVTVNPGDYTSHVLLVQIRLNELGYYHGRFSGRYDDMTVEAVKNYQESQALAADGVCHPETLQKLFP